MLVACRPRRADDRDRDLAVRWRAAVPEAARDAQVRGHGRARQHEPGAARHFRHVDRPAGRLAADRAPRDAVPRVPRLHLRAREARPPGAALPVEPDHAALAGARLGPDRVARPRPRDVPGGDRRGHPLRSGRERRIASDDLDPGRGPNRDGAREARRGRPDPRPRRSRAEGVLQHHRRGADAHGAADPPGDGQPADHRVRADRLDDRRQPADRRHQLRRRRSAAARDPRQPGGGRPRERPARAVARRAVAAQGGAPAPGLPRPADRPGQPRPLRRAGRGAAHRSAGKGSARSSSSSTSTTSRSSTTPSATRPATGCWRPWPTGSAAACDPTTWRPGSAATSSRSS